MNSLYWIHFVRAGVVPEALTITVPADSAEQARDDFQSAQGALMSDIRIIRVLRQTPLASLLRFDKEEAAEYLRRSPRGIEVMQEDGLLPRQWSFTREQLDSAEAQYVAKTRRKAA